MTSMDPVEGGVVAPRDALAELLAAVDRQEAAIFLARAALAPVASYDSIHAGDLVKTLREYFRCHCNVSQAASVLFLHRNGLIYRLSRIEALLGVSLADRESRLALELALHVLERAD
ncbi:MAG TPA: helix-turn-helix domain-containing protein [Chloroflexota bacterium]|nr:helix-turn-helix domain-containing protein [Chloroflexota bacterium]